MRKTVGLMAGLACISSATQAQVRSDEVVGRSTGVFVGAQFRVPLNGKAKAKPRATLGISPAFSRATMHGTRTAIGDGLGLSFTPGAKPNLTLGAARADRALGLTRRSGPGAHNKQGISTLGWVGIGVGTALVAGVIGLALWADHVSDCEERENGC
jgi:hypothetical protein